MTRLETQVLDLLREDCRLPLEKLAVMLGVSTEEVAETIDSLERRRVILHYAPTINWDLTDRERVEAMIQVSATWALTLWHAGFTASRRSRASI